MKVGTNSIPAERWRLENGLTVLVSPNRKLPLVSLNAFLLAGKDQNPMDRPGTASLTARLLDEGTRKYSADEISEILENMGASSATFSQRELSGAGLVLQSSDFLTGLEVLAEIYCRPTFETDRFERERQRMLGHLQAMADDPQNVGSERLNQIVYGQTPLAFPALGTPDGLNRLRACDLAEFHRRNYAPENTLLIVVGDVEPQRALAQIEPCFAGWANPDFQLKPLPPLVKQSRPIFDRVTMEKEQLNIYVGHLGITRNNPDFYALQVMDIILGGGPGFTARIPRRLRDEQALAYSTYSDISGSSGRYPGRFVAFICTSPDHGRQALDGILHETRELAENGITPDELEMAKDYLTGSFVFEFQSNASIARFLLVCEMFGLGDDFAERYREIIQAITREEVSRVARQYLDTLNYSTVIVGPVD